MRGRVSARGIVFCQDSVALIRRTKNGKTYYVFPGGGVEPGEAYPDACRREVLEELGLETDVGPMVIDHNFNGNTQLYFLCSVTGGRFGHGIGPEYAADLPPELGLYEPVWLPVDSLDSYPILPACACEIVAHLHRYGFSGRLWQTEEDAHQHTRILVRG